LGRFPQQQPFELFEELVCFSAAQLGLDAGLIEFYRRRQPTISEHQQTITGYLRLRPFDDAEAAQLEQFLFEKACRLEQAAALMGQAREFLKERRDVFYGRRGRINARELWEQMNTCSCLNLILACIVYWQACEISRVLSECDPVARPGKTGG